MSSLHDGMNLVAKEFVAARDDERGVLVLSQFTGAARELTEALIVNPYDLEEASAALAAALAHAAAGAAGPDARRCARFVAEFNVYRWAGRMLVDAARLRRRERLTGRLRPPVPATARRLAVMRHILARANRDVLQQFAWSRVLLAFDYDGTLAPIVRDPDKAAMRASTRRLLLEVSRAYPCVVISGRSRADVRRKVREVRLMAVMGNHGIEPWHTSAAARRRVRGWIDCCGKGSLGSRGPQSRTRATRCRSITAAASTSERPGDACWRRLWLFGRNSRAASRCSTCCPRKHLTRASP